jgi:DNA-binding MarR family transcriptional regulator
MRGPGVARVSDEAEEFGEAFDAFARAVRRARGAAPADPSKALTLSQFALLEPLATRQRARVAELADEAGVAAPTATRILDALERRGIVRRDRASDDRRAVAVTLTDAGRELLDGQRAWVRERRRAFVLALPEEQQALAPAFVRALAGLIDELAAGPVDATPGG